MTRFQVGLLGLFVLTLVAMAVPSLGMLIALTFIGLPVAFALWAIPAIFLVVALTYAYWRVLPLPRWVGAGAAAALCAVTLTVPAYLLNLKIKADAEVYAAEDHNNLKLPLSPKVIAVRSNRGFNRRNRSGCDGFCLHALLNDVAREVVRVRVKDPLAQMSPEETGIAYRLEKRAQCPVVKFVPGGHELQLPREKGEANKRRPSAEQAMRLRMSEGHCLVEREAKLDEADVVITDLRLLRRRRAMEAGFSLTTDLTSADRYLVHTRDATASDLKEVYRWTGVRYQPFFWALVPGPLFGSSFDVEMGWLRRDKKINIDAKRYHKPDWPKFLTKTLGLDLRLDGTKTQERIGEKLQLVLNEDRDPTREEWDAFSTYFKSRVQLRNLSASDFELAMQVLESPRFPAPPRSYMITRYAQAKRDKALMTKITALFFKRLMNKPTWSQSLGVSHARSLKNLALGLRRLPDELFEPYYQELTDLAADPLAREHAYVLLSKLSVFGDQAAPVLVSLIDAGTTGGQYFFRENEYQHPYMAGMRGLCLAGANAKSALPELDARMSEGKLPAHASYGDLLVKTMVRLGADAERVWPVYSSGQQNPQRARFNKQVKQAGSHRPRC